MTLYKNYTNTIISEEIHVESERDNKEILLTRKSLRLPEVYGEVSEQSYRTRLYKIHIISSSLPICHVLAQYTHICGRTQIPQSICFVAFKHYEA